MNIKNKLNNLRPEHGWVEINCSSYLVCDTWWNDVDVEQYRAFRLVVEDIGDDMCRVRVKRWQDETPLLWWAVLTVAALVITLMVTS